ncbi:uncharacterized protein [Typha latifolia]|uniref:uncharacterized protein n=1 Tax=Typha latifolia TaxID=4733 RepID=UPI003C2CAD21
MPKNRTRSASFERCSRASPYCCSSSSGRSHCSSSSRNPSEPAVVDKDSKEWEEVRCPVCMEHPHNAVLLQCSSYKTGCRPFMCDTSYRHSNCLDQYRKAFPGPGSSEANDEGKNPCQLSCPLCRGTVTGWTVVEPARHYMNLKVRSCSTESCSFSGVYGELRKHARKEHPSVRPSEVDPERERDWHQMEQQRDLGDLFSMLQSNTNRVEDSQDEEEFGGTVYAFPSITVLLIVQSGTGQSALRFSGNSTRASSGSQRGRRMIIWGETASQPDQASSVVSNHSNNGDYGDSDGVSEDATAGSDQHNGGRRRRQLRMLDDDDDDDEDEIL